jgi:hypothetical protein
LEPRAKLKPAALSTAVIRVVMKFKAQAFSVGFSGWK